MVQLIMLTNQKTNKGGIMKKLRVKIESDCLANKEETDADLEGALDYKINKWGFDNEESLELPKEKIWKHLKNY